MNHWLNMPRSSNKSKFVLDTKFAAEVKVFIKKEIFKKNSINIL